MVLAFMYVFVIVIVILYIVRFLLTKNHDYWKNRKVPYKEPLIIFGNYKETILMKKHQTLVTKEICDFFPNEPYIGTFFGTDPALIVQDPELIKRVMVTDFNYFSGREVSDYSQKEPLTNNIFFSGGDKWKIPRQNITPLFTSARIKGMFHLIMKCANQLEYLIKNEIRNSPYVDVKALLSKYTIDCITSCAFGVNSNTMKEDEEINPFIIMREKIMESTAIRGMKINCRKMWPALFYGLRFSLFDYKIVEFFQTLLTGVFKSRQGTNSNRNDFVDLLLTWKEKDMLTGESINKSKSDYRKEVSIKVSEDLIIAQCVLLFTGGFETTSSTLSFLLFEIAKRQDIQAKLLGEVDKYLEQHNGEIEYECVNELPYMFACIEETLRLYPVLGVLTREVMANYTLPTGLHLQKGNRIHIPVYKIHHDPDYFPEPEVFRPERFYGVERTFVKPCTYMPFGEGPRICLGLRFAKMPMHVSLLTILKNYRVELAENMPQSLPFQPVSIVTAPAIDINLKFISRKHDI